MIEWFDDLRLGMRFTTKEAQITADDIKRFAAEFDPQAFHLDEAAAQHSVFKGLAASGWHTAAIAMRLAVEARPFGRHPLIGLGVDDLRWMAKPQGIARVKWTAFTQSGEAVYSFTPIGIVPRRPGVPVGEAIAS
jgi:hypothetical protein